MIEKRIEFLYNAINDAQELIRFIDNKVAIVITILGSYIIGFFVSIVNLFQYSEYYSCAFWFFLILFIVSLIGCILVTARIIKPTNNPCDNIELGNSTAPLLKFFLPINVHCRGFMFHNFPKCKLNTSYEGYLQILNNSSEDDIIKTLTYELLKVSFIRNIKNERFNWLLIFLISTTILFFTAYIFYSSETQNAIEIEKILNFWNSPDILNVI